MPRWNPKALLQRLRSFPRFYTEVLRILGNMETSWLVILGALFWFAMFGGIWLLMLLELVASWWGIPFDVWTDVLGPITFGDFVASTFFAWLMVFITGNVLYGRFFMSREEADSMVRNWPDKNPVMFMLSDSGPYSWKALRFFLRLSAGVCFLMLLSLVILFFVE